MTTAYLRDYQDIQRGVCDVKFQDFGRGARIELSKMARQLGMKFIGYNPSSQVISLEYEGKGVTFTVEEFIRHFKDQRMAKA